MRTIFCLTLLAAIALGAQEPSRWTSLEGEWIAAAGGRGITAANIARAGPGWVVDIWGGCEEIDCKSSSSPLTLADTSAASLDSSRAATEWSDKAATNRAVIYRRGDDLTIELTTVYRDNRPTAQTATTLHRQGQPSSAPAPSPLEATIAGLFKRELDISIPRPALFNDLTATDCFGFGHLATTAYVETGRGMTSLFGLYTSRNGTRVSRRIKIANVLRPAGTIPVLTVIARHRVTVGSDALPMWETAQKAINEQHAAFARAHGYPKAVVVFDNTNVVVHPTEIQDPNDPKSVRAAAAKHGVSPGEFQIVMMINIDPERSEGGLSRRDEQSIYVGNYSNWKDALGPREWAAIARTAYHHEMAHHWGWDHDWAPTCGNARPPFAPFIAPPILFGWEDVDGDGVPEILDGTPYGRSR